MGRLAQLMEHPRESMRHAAEYMVPQRKSSIGGIVLLAVIVLGIAWMWPEMQRYIKMRRM